MNSAQEMKSAVLSVRSGVWEVLRALYFYGADYIMLKVGRRERLVHKEQLISLMELSHESANINEISDMTLPEPASAKTRVEDVPSDTALLLFLRKGGGTAGVLSMTSFGEYRERKIKESDIAYPEWWGAPLPLLYMDDERVALNDAAGAKIPCDAKGLAAQTEKMKRDGIIAVKHKNREMTFSLNHLEENVYLIEDVSGDFEMAEELVWWAAVGKAFVRRLEENGTTVRRMSPLEAPPDSAAEILPCLWDNEHLGSIAIGIPSDVDGTDAPASGAGIDKKEGETASSDDEGGTELSAPSKPEPPETEASARTEDAETGPASEKPSGGKRARKARKRPARKKKQEEIVLLQTKDDQNLDLNAESEPSIQKNEPPAVQPEMPAQSVWHESFGPFGKLSAKRGKTAGRGVAKKGGDGKGAVSEGDLPRPICPEGVEEAGEDVKIEESADKTAVPKLLDKNAARKAYGGSQRKKAPNAG
jgi:hypothetical protein